ncbi:MAG: hypothetical protein IT427_21010 [Pirellulales bacterium]|nr:hypothetical protein [Pirellulales bacterium]
MSNRGDPPMRLAGAMLAAIALLAGCDYQSTRQSGSTSSRNLSSGQTRYKADVLRSAASMLSSPERFDNEEDVSKQIVEQLNQWIRMVRAAKEVKAGGGTDETVAVSPSDWRRDPLIESLPESLRRTRAIRALDIESFDEQYDGQFLREVSLLRDAVASIQPAKLDELSIASAIFDWTVRNIQIEREPLPDEEATPAEKWLALHLPQETLYFGRGTPLSRAWVLMLLARQAGLETVLLAVPDARNSDDPRPWAVGLLSGGKIFLFDYTYGLPVLGPGGKGIATLAEAAADDAVLRQMDIPGGRIYPRTADELKQSIVLLEASPGYLSRRMKLLESHLTGRDRMVLTTNPSALAEKLKGLSEVAEVRLWKLPYETLAERQKIYAALQDEVDPYRPAAIAMAQQQAIEQLPFKNLIAPDQKSSQAQSDTELRPESREEIRRREKKFYALRLGRLLHLRGVYGGGRTNEPDGEAPKEQSEIVERGARYYYLKAILTQQEIDDITRKMEQGFEFAPGVRWTKEGVDAIEQMRDDAKFWLGLIWFSTGGYQNAEQFLQPLTETKADNMWTSGARYNLARAYEAAGRLQNAIKLYGDDRSPQRYGNRLRAERLEEQMGKK